MLPVCYTMVLIIFVLPFIGEGPLYASIIRDFYQNSCETYWWTNLILISNYYPWNVEEMCGSHFSLIANEFQLVVILIPLFGYIYKNYYRLTLISAFCFIGICGSIIPVLNFTTKSPPVDAYAGFLNGSYNDMLTKIYYRLPPFLIGIAVAIFNFEYKHVNKLNNGSKPFHKDYIDRWSKNKYTFKAITYCVGFVSSAAAIIFLWVNAQCLSSES
jgi:hypothetical protein